MTGCGIMSSVWGMILRRGSIIKVSIELLVATRHRHDMTEFFFKATVKPEQTPTSDVILFMHVLKTLTNNLF